MAGLGLHVEAHCSHWGLEWRPGNRLAQGRKGLRRYGRWTLLLPLQDRPWVFVQGEGTEWWEALTPTGPDPGLSARQLPCSMMQPW